MKLVRYIHPVGQGAFYTEQFFNEKTRELLLLSMIVAQVQIKLDLSGKYMVHLKRMTKSTSFSFHTFMQIISMELRPYVSVFMLKMFSFLSTTKKNV